MIAYKGVHTFPKGISPKVNVLAQLEFELTYYDVAVQHISHYAMSTPTQNTTGTPPPTKYKRIK